MGIENVEKRRKIIIVLEGNLNDAYTRKQKKLFFLSMIWQ